MTGMINVKIEHSVYLASRYSEHPTMRQWRDRIEATGYYKVTSRWILGEHEMLDGSDSREVNLRFAKEDLEDLAAARILVFDSRKEIHSANRGGRHTELGFALGLKQLGRLISIQLVGEPQNVFHSMVDRVHPTPEDMFKYFEETEPRFGDLIVGYEKPVLKSIDPITGQHNK